MEYRILFFAPRMNTATIPFFTLPLKNIPWSRFFGSFLAQPIDFLLA